jgi:acyl-CoA thioesterase-1
MQMPPSMGNKYASAFKEAFRQLADKNKAHLIPFILEGVGGVPELNQQDGIHPTPKGHKIVEENVWKVLKGLL